MKTKMNCMFTKYLFIPLVSGMMPVYNDFDILLRALAAILASTLSLNVSAGLRRPEMPVSERILLSFFFFPLTSVQPLWMPFLGTFSF